MMWYGWDGGLWGFVWMFAWMIFIAAMVWAILAVLFRSSRDEGAKRGDPRDTIAERFAKGEIDADEYRERRQVLDDSSVGGTRR